MASHEAPKQADLSLLAAEVLDLWQEHLATYATDPSAKAELMKLLEPQRQLFADWTTMMQHGLYGTGATKKSNGNNGTQAPTHGAAPVATSSNDSALRVAQLAHRLAELEKRIAKLESGNGQNARKTARRSKHS